MHRAIKRLSIVAPFAIALGCAAPSLAETQVRGELVSSCGADRPRINLESRTLGQAQFSIHGATHASLLYDHLTKIAERAERIVFVGCLGSTKNKWTTHTLEAWVPREESLIRNADDQPLEVVSVSIRFYGNRPHAVVEAPLMAQVETRTGGSVPEHPHLRIYSVQELALAPLSFWHVNDVSGDSAWFEETRQLNIEPVDAD